MRDKRITGTFQSVSKPLENEKTLTLHQVERVLDTFDDVVFILDNDDNFLKCFHPATFQFIVPAYIPDYNIQPELCTNFLAHIFNHKTKLKHTGDNQQFECCIKKNDKLKWFACSLAQVADDKDKYTLSVRNITAQHEAEDALKSQAEKYELLAENTTDLVALYNNEGKIEYISPSVKKLLGYNADDLRGVDPSGYIHPDDLAYIRENFKVEVFKNDAFFSTEYRLRHADGHWVHFSSNRKPIRNAGNEVTHVLACCRNISERVAADEALQKSEAHYRLLADNIIDLVALHNAEGTLEYVSPSSLAVLGYKPEELLRKKVYDLVHPDDFAKLLARNHKMARNGIDKFMDEFRILHKNGNWICFETTTKIINQADKKSSKFLTTSRDITEWKNAQLALQDSEEKYRCLIESSEALIAVLDTKGVYLYTNEQRESFLKVNRKNVAGKTVYDFYSKEIADNFMKHFNKAIDENTKVVFETSIKVGDNETWVRASIQPLVNLQGKIYAAMVSSIDITGNKRSEDKLLRQNAELRQIAFMQSHLVRAPLANLKGLLSLLNKDEFSDVARNIFYMIDDSADKLDNVIREIVEKSNKADNI